MRKCLFTMVLLFLLAVPAEAMEICAPEAPDRVEDLVPDTADSFGEGLWNLIKAAIGEADGPLRDAMSCCLGASSAVLLCSVLGELSPDLAGSPVNIACCVTVAGILLGPSDSLLRLGLDTAEEIREYGKLLIPVMTGAMAAQGGATSATALYAGTAWFNTILSSLLFRLMRPMVYLYLALAVADAVLMDRLLEKMGQLIQWIMTWMLKLTLYFFTGYMTITGVISSHADAAAVRAAKAAISTAVPVVGGILSDASELVLASAGTLGSAAGVYGILTVLALFVGPFLRIGVHHLLLKGVSVFCGAFHSGGTTVLLERFANAMGMVLAMIGTQMVLLIVGTACFMKGVG